VSFDEMELIEAILFVSEISALGLFSIVLTFGCVSEGEESTLGSERSIGGFNTASFVRAGVIGAKDGAFVGCLDGAFVGCLDGRFVGRGEGSEVIGLSVGRGVLTGLDRDPFPPPGFLPPLGFLAPLLGFLGVGRMVVGGSVMGDVKSFGTGIGTHGLVGDSDTGAREGREDGSGV